MNRTIRGDRLRVLMVGYNGANNTGAEALLQSDIDDVRAVLGPAASITVPTLNERNLRRYLSENDDLRIVRIPTLYFGAIRRLVAEADLVMLVEGSTYMDTWGSPLLWAFLWASRCASSRNKESLAYAVDAGSLSAANARRVASIASSTGMIITRNRAAADRLHAIGVSAPIEWTADNAFTFEPKREDEGWIDTEWPLRGNGTVGIAAVDYTAWPAVFRPWGAKSNCYKWPYYYSRSPERSRAAEGLAEGYARLADRIIAGTGHSVAFVCMEQLDETLATAIRARMRRPEDARIFSARYNDASRMTALLRSLSLLITSRFHASVLSLAGAVPQIAVGHDTRLRTLYADIGLAEDWFLDPRAGDGSGVALDGGLFEKLELRVERLLADPRQQAEKLRTGYRDHLRRARRNRELLAEFLGARFGRETRSESPLVGAAKEGVE